MAKAPKSRKPAKGKGPKGPARRGAKPAKSSARKGAKPAKFTARNGARPGKRWEPRGPRQAAAARPGPPRARRAPEKKRALPVSAPIEAPVLREPDDGQERALRAVAAGLDKKAEEPVVLDVRGLSGVADYFVVLSADSDRQAAAIADAVDERLEALGASRLGIEGRSGGGWVLLDYGDVVVHVMGRRRASSTTSRGCGPTLPA